MTDPLTAGELLAILAVLLARLGKDHPLTRASCAASSGRPRSRWMRSDDERIDRDQGLPSLR